MVRFRDIQGHGIARAFFPHVVGHQLSQQPQVESPQSLLRMQKHPPPLPSEATPNEKQNKYENLQHQNANKWEI